MSKHALLLKKIIQQKTFWFGFVLILGSFILNRYIHSSWLEDLPSSLLVFGLGLIVTGWLKDEVKEYTDEIITAELGNGKILEKFSKQALKEFISTALEKYAPDFYARTAISDQVESARNNPSLGKKRAKQYKLVIGDFERVAITSAPVNPDRNALCLDLADYFQCKFIEIYDLLLSSKECDKPIYVSFTLRKEMLHKLFQENTCIYRDLLLLSGKDEKKLEKFLNENKDKTFDQNPFGKLLNAHLEIKVPGACDLNIIKNPKIKINADGKGIEFRFSLSAIKTNLTSGEAFCEVVNTVEFPVWKEVRGYPLIFMSYSKSPAIEFIASSPDIVENSFIPFLSCVDSRAYRVTPPELGRNPKTWQIKVDDNLWVLPFSGVYITWHLKDSQKSNGTVAVPS